MFLPNNFGLQWFKKPMEITGSLTVRAMPAKCNQ